MSSSLSLEITRLYSSKGDMGATICSTPKLFTAGAIMACPCREGASGGGVRIRRKWRFCRWTFYRSPALVLVSRQMQSCVCCWRAIVLRTAARSPTSHVRLRVGGPDDQNVSFIGREMLPVRACAGQIVAVGRLEWRLGSFQLLPDEAPKMVLAINQGFFAVSMIIIRSTLYCQVQSIALLTT